MSLVSPFKHSPETERHGAELDRALMRECFARSRFSTATMPFVIALWWYVVGDAANHAPAVRAAYVVLLVFPAVRALVYWAAERAPEAALSTAARFWIFFGGATLFGAAIAGWTVAVHPFLDAGHTSLVALSVAVVDLFALVNISPAPLAYISFLVSSLLPTALALASRPEPLLRTKLIVAIAIFACSLVVLSLRLHASLWQALALTAQLRDVALHDPLTGLPNRRAVDEHLAKATASPPRQGHHALAGRAVLMVDVDHFKAVNDTHGHDGGDAVLKQVADALRSSVRPSDLVARWGGEEFIVMAVGVPRVVALSIAERIRRRVEAREIRLADGTVLGCTCSVGLSWLPSEDEDQVTPALRAADAALYRAKRLGRNRVEEARWEEIYEEAPQALPAAVATASI